MTSFAPIGKSVASACKAAHYREFVRLCLVRDQSFDAMDDLLIGSPEWVEAKREFVAAHNAVESHVAKWEKIEGRRYPRFS